MIWSPSHSDTAFTVPLFVNSCAGSCRARIGSRNRLLTELRRGVLEYCVLSVLQHRESYAFEIVRNLSDAGELLTSEGTIYPLLARLRRDELVTTMWRESEAGPPRRYYRLTESTRCWPGMAGEGPEHES